MAQKHLHELLREDQEPFQLKDYIADRRFQLNKPPKKTPSSILQQSKKQKPSTTTLAKHVCFLSYQDSPDVRKSPLKNFPSPLPRNSPARKKLFINVPASTSSLLLEAAMRIQKQQQTQKTKPQMGFNLFGFLKKLRNKKRELQNIANKEEIITKYSQQADTTTGLASSCNNSRLSSAGWSESNDLESCCSSSRSETEEIEELAAVINGEIGKCDGKKYCASPLSPFRFNLQRCSSLTGRRTPEFSSPVASPIRHKNEGKGNDEATSIEEEEEEKEQCSPVSVLDPPFDDDGHEDRDEDEDEEEDDDCDLDCNYALVQRAQQQLLYKLRRFEKLAELDPIELEKLMLEDEDIDDFEEQEDCQDDDDDDDNSVLSYGDEDLDKIPFDMKRLVSDLISEEKIETSSNSNNKEDVVFGRVRKRLDSWQYVRSNTINMMVESDLKGEFDDWKKFQEQREETATEFEVSIFGLLVEELAEELLVV